MKKRALRLLICLCGIALFFPCLVLAVLLYIPLGADAKMIAEFPIFLMLPE